MKSQILQEALFNIDEHVLALEIENQRLKDENIELKKEISIIVNSQIQDGNNMIKGIFQACFNEPSLDSIGTTGAIVLSSINDMKNIDEVHEYINKIFKVAKKNKNDNRKTKH